MILFELVDMFLKIMVIFIGSVTAYNFIVRIAKGSKVVQNYIYLLVFFFYIFPILLKAIFPRHQYTSFVRANEAMNNPIANVFYDLFVIGLVFFFIRSSKKYLKYDSQEVIYNRFLTNLCTAMIVLSFGITVITNGVSNLLGYASGYLNENLNVNEILIGTGIICYLVLLGYKRFISNARIVAMTFLVFGLCWFVGKRYIIAETLIMSIYVLAITGEINGGKILRYIAISGIGLIAFCVYYGAAIKGNFNSLVDYLLVDFSRQYTLVYQFYCSLIHKSISVNRFDAILYLLTFYVPRTLWPNKPYPFVNQLTYSLVSWSDMPSNVNMGWATTCSIFSDLYDSFSFLGIILAIFMLSFLFKKINTIAKPHYKIILMYLTVRLLTVQISSAIVQIVICWGIVFLGDMVGKNRIQE